MISAHDIEAFEQPGPEPLKMHQMVRAHRVLHYGIFVVPVGTVGVVVDIYRDHKAYEVEFSSHPGRVVTADRAALEPLTAVM